jgi:hypothetical protein
MRSPQPLARVIIASTIFAALVSVFLLHTVIPAAGKLTHGFLAYYVGAQVIKDGEPGARLYDEKWFSARVLANSGGQVTDIYLTNPPILAVAWLPLAYLPVETARKLWLGLSVIGLGLTIGLIATQLAGEGQRATSGPLAGAGQLAGSGQWLGAVGLTALCTLPAPTREQFQLGQMYSFLLLLHVIGWRAYARRQDTVAGIALGLAMALKISGWPVGLLMLAQRRWHAVAWSVAVGVGAAVLTLPWVGIEAWRMLFFVALPKALHWPAATLTAYQDTPGFWQHWLRYDARFNPTPIMNAPLVASVLSLSTTAIACFAVLRGQRPTYVSFAAAVALIELLSPVAEQYHYMVLLLPLAVLWHLACLLRSSGAFWAAAAATFLIAWPMDYKAPHPDWAVLASYPRLCGGWIVFGGLLITWRDRPAPLR